MAWKKIQWSDDGGSVVVRKNSGSNIGTRPRLNFIEGSNVTLSISDDAGSNEVDISIAATQYSHPSAPPCRSATSGQTGHATAAQIGKLNGIESAADKTDATNVAAAGAVMDSDTSISVNTISESSGGSGVTIDGVLNKDSRNMLGFLGFGTPAEATISSNHGITATQTFLRVDTYNGAATYELHEIFGSNVKEGDILILMAESTSRVVTVTTGCNIGLVGGASFALVAYATLVLMYRASKGAASGGNEMWLEVSRAVAPVA